MGGGGFSPLGGGTVNFGGSLTREEQAAAAAQLGLLETKNTAVAAAERDVSAEANAAARAVGAMGAQGAYALDRFTALGGVLGSSGAFGIGVGAAVIGLTTAFEMGKSMIDNADTQEQAVRDLSQAYATLGEKVPTVSIDTFINQNARFIPSMYSVELGFAAMARAGFNDTEQIKLMNLALDLSAAKHIDLTTAETALIDAEHGRMLGLISLGISQKEIDEALGKHATQAEKNAALEDLLSKKLQGARNDTSQLTQSQDQLRVTWEKMSNDNGPALAGMLSAVLDRTNDLLNGMRNSGPVWNWLDGQITGNIIKWRDLANSIDSAVNSLRTWAGQTNNTPVASGGNLRLSRGAPAPINQQLTRLTSN